MLNNRGFTLLEVLIAVVLLGILSSALYGSYFTVLRARDRASEGMETRRELGSTLDLLRREIASTTKFNRDDPRLRFVVEDRDYFGKPASKLELTALTASTGEGRKESGIINVQYRMLEKDKKQILTRREQDMFFVNDTSPFYPQMESITSFLVECSDDGSKWVRTWDTALNGSLPRKVRITIQIEENGKPVEFFVYSAPKVTGS